MDTEPGSRERKRHTEAERQRLARTINRERSKTPPTPWRELAVVLDVPERTLRRIQAEFKKQAPGHESPLGRDTLRETLFVYNELINRLAYETEFGDNSSARVGAAGRLIRALEDRRALLAATGHMPWNTNGMREYDAARELAEEIVEILRRFPHHEEIAASLERFMQKTNPLIAQR